MISLDRKILASIRYPKINKNVILRWLSVLLNIFPASSSWSASGAGFETVLPDSGSPDASSSRSHGGSLPHGQGQVLVW